MVSVAALSVLTKFSNSLGASPSGGSHHAGTARSVEAATSSTARLPFLRIPPFSSTKFYHFTSKPGHKPDTSDLVDLVRQLRVGGSYWAAQPELPGDYILLRTPAALKLPAALAGDHAKVLWTPEGACPARPSDVQVIAGDCDPWHMVSSAAALVVQREDEVRLIARLLGVKVYLLDPRTGEVTVDEAAPEALLDSAIGAASFENPFTGDLMTPREAVELCGFWRQLIDSNRDIVGGIGFAFWKQDHIAPLLWGGSTPVQFLRVAGGVAAGQSVAVWRAKAAPEALADLELRGISLIEVEDGFLRSRGLGADCIPPLSITLDRLGAHFDPSRPSELERMLEVNRFDAQTLERASRLRRLIVAAGIGKYERGSAILGRPGGGRRHLLVPGQVEDDRAVQVGGCGLVSNLELLRRVREQAPDAYILYKPHPDVVAGHRRGSVPDRTCLQYADEIVGELPIASLIAMVDEVHVNTSLAGFEALLRGKRVTTYGVPFYAGWGLTHDLGPVPPRRTARRTIDELVAAALLLYPRYLDPVTGLPCPAEVVVARLSIGEEQDPGLLVNMRRLQGKLMRRLRRLVP